MYVSVGSNSDSSKSESAVKYTALSFAEVVRGFCDFVTGHVYILVDDNELESFSSTTFVSAWIVSVASWSVPSAVSAQSSSYPSSHHSIPLQF
jgi:hypothetical protein